MQVFRPKMRTEEILEALRPVLDAGWIGLGPKTKEFEAALAERLDLPAEYVVATNSCTAALHLAMEQLGLPMGSKVATTPLTFVSTNHAIRYAGLSPVFYDVFADTGNAHPQSVEFMVKEYGCKAIVVVHMGGYPCEMNEIRGVAEKYNIPVVEDCAHALGASYRGVPVGGEDSQTSCFSFHAVKNLPAGDGGAIVTSYHERCRRARWMGIDQDTATRAAGGSYKWEYDVRSIGYKYHMNDITATIALVQLAHLDEDNARRAEIAKYYREHIKGASFPYYKEHNQSAYHFFPIFFENRDKVYDALVENDIWPGMHYRLNTRYLMYAGCPQDLCKEDLTGAQEYESEELTLPIHPMLTDGDVSKVVDVVNSVARKA